MAVNMETAVIVSCSDKGTVFFTELLNAAAVGQIAVAQSCGAARKLFSERDFDLIIINAPLRDESGENLARHTASQGTAQVILAVKSEYFEAVSAACENYGVLTISKPVNKTLFLSALTLAKSARSSFKRIQAENEILKQKIEDIRIVDRAKCILISHMSMSEREAHRYIEKQAMDMRSAKREIAESILKTYEN